MAFARRLASVAGAAAAIAVAALSGPAALAARVGNFDVHLVAWNLSINYAPYVEARGAAGGTLGYCASVGDEGLTVQFAWKGASKGQGFSYLLSGPHRTAVFKRGKFTTTPWSTTGVASVAFQRHRHPVWAPRGRYRFSFSSQGRTLIASTLRLAANAC